MGTVRGQIVATVKGKGDIVQATVDTITQTLTTARSASRLDATRTAAIADVASGAVHGAAEVGADLGQAAKGIMLGVLRRTNGAETEILGTIRHTAHVAIWDTTDVGGDIEAAATGLIAGAIEGAKELSVDAEAAAAAAADGALKAAGQIGPTAVANVRKGVIKPVNGIKVVLKEARWVPPTNKPPTDADWCGKAQLSVRQDSQMNQEGVQAVKPKLQL